MPKAYWIAHVDITDAQRYPEYVRLNKAAFDKYGARFIVRGGAFEAKEGKARQRHVVIEFKDMTTAKACYDSAEYAAALAVRKAAATSDLIIVEGTE